MSIRACSFICFTIIAFNNFSMERWHIKKEHKGNALHQTYFEQFYIIIGHTKPMLISSIVFYYSYKNYIIKQEKYYYSNPASLNSPASSARRSSASSAIMSLKFGIFRLKKTKLPRFPHFP